MQPAPREQVGALARIGLIASFAPTLQSMPAEFPTDVHLDELVETAMQALNGGDPLLTMLQVADAARRLQGVASM